MTQLPVKPSPNEMKYELIDRGFFQGGASSLRVTKPGSRHRFEFRFPPMKPDESAAFEAKLKRAKRTGVQIDIPVRRNQGISGSPVFDGAVTTMLTAVPMRGFRPGYAIKENFWFTATEAATGQKHVYSVFETVIADENGEATVEIEPPLRAPFADGDTIEFDKPFVTGFMVGEVFTVEVSSDDFVKHAVVIEEYR